MSFAVVGPLGAVELRLVFSAPGPHREWIDSWGFEQHKADPNGKPDCWLIEGPCEHDGTSLWAREHWLPRFRERGTVWLWPALEVAYRERLAPGQEAKS